MLLSYFTILGLALFFIVIIIIGGSYISKKFNISFAFFSFLSILLYLGVSYIGTILIDPIAGITLLAIIGLFEATIGFKLMIKLGANLDDFNNDMDEMQWVDDKHNLHPIVVVFIMLLYMILGWIGTLFA